MIDRRGSQRELRKRLCQPSMIWCQRSSVVLDEWPRVGSVHGASEKNQCFPAMALTDNCSVHVQPSPTTLPMNLEIALRFGFRFIILCAAELSVQTVCRGQPDPNWLDHDRGRPLPPVVSPTTPSTQESAGKPPSDARVLF